MKRVLLIGNLNEIVRSLYECLMNDFQVQLSFGEVDTIKGIYKIVNPDMLVVNQIETEDMDPAVLEWLQSLSKDIPILFISVEDRWNEYREYCEGNNFDKLFRPISKDELVSKCYRMLRMESPRLHVEKAQTRKKIMVIDDSPLLLRNMKSLLQDKYTVSVATSGEQALKLVPSKQPDLILLDYEMPGWDGKKTYEMLKEQEHYRNIPVIFLTSVSDKEHIADILETRPAGYILKPPDQDRLLRTIEDVIAGNM